MAEPSTPAQVGPYRVLGLAGRGGMGIVYRAEHLATGARVAVKTVHVPNERWLAGIRCEILALSRLQHPGIVKIVDSGVEAGRPWYAMELLEGRTVGDVHSDLWSVSEDAPTGALVSDSDGIASAPVPASHSLNRATVSAPHLAEVLRLVRGLCGPLAYLHGHGLVHRDLKPANVFVRPDGRPVLTDFGLAVEVRGGVGREVLTVGGRVAGSGHYMAPEQVEGRLVDARADLYALGVILYELLTGQRPYVAATLRELLKRQRAAPPRPPSELAAGLPAGLDALVGGLLAGRARDRLGHAEDVAAALDELGAAAPPAASEPAASPYLYKPELEGRDEPLERLARRLEQTLEGEGGLVLLGGESGVGKTTLAVELGRMATLRGFEVVLCECLPGGGPLHPFRALLSAVADRCLEQGAETTARLLGPRGRVLEPLLPELGALPHLRDVPAAVPLAAEESRRRLLHDLGRTLVAFAADAPLLMVLDDLQWADELSLALLEGLGALLDGTRLLVLGTYRSEEVGEALRPLVERADALAVRLPRLDEAALGRMVAGMLALAAPPEQLVRHLAHHSEGNPFFVAEYLRSAVTRRLLYRRAGQWRVAEAGGRGAGEAALPLPGSLRELIAHRLDELDATARALADAGSVLGRELEPSLLAATAGLPEQPFLEGVEALLARQVLEQGEDGALRFAHDKLREVAYAALADTRRRTLHAAAAAALESELDGTARERRHAELARHWWIAGGLAQARHHAQLGGAEALARGAYGEALGLLQMAREADERLGAEALDAVGRARVERRLGEACYGLGRFDDARAHVEAALARLGRRLPRSGPGRGAALALQALRQLARGTPAADAATAAGADEAAGESIRAYYALVHVAFHTNDLGTYTLGNLSMLNLAGRAGPSPELAEAFALTSLVCGLTGLRGPADTYARRARETADAAGSPAALASVLMITSVDAAGIGRWSQVDEATRAGATLADQIGDSRRWDECTSLAALAAYHRGELAAARRLWASVAERTRSAQPRLWSLCGRAEVALRRGGPGHADEALEHLSAAEALLQAERLAPADELRVEGELALARLRRGEPQAARRHAELALERHRAHPRPSAFWALEGIAAAAEAALALLAAGGRAAEAAALTATANELVRALARYARVFPIGAPRAALLRGLLDAGRGRGEAARRAWRSAEAAAARLDMPWERGRALLELGRLEPTGSATRRQQLLAALPPLTASHATQDLEQANALLAAEDAPTAPLATSSGGSARPDKEAP